MFVFMCISDLCIYDHHGNSPFLRTVNPGKPSISMGHLYHGYVSHNQRSTLGYPKYFRVLWLRLNIDLNIDK